MTTDTWEPFGIPDDQYNPSPEHDGVKWLNLTLRRPRSQGDRSATWLRWATLALGTLAAAAAVVSFEAQYTMIYARRGNSAIAGLEAAIPDTAALVFACLGIALALHGKRAIRPRILNVASVATSVTMNLLAAGPGWRDWAIWALPPVAYALASDTLIGVVRAHAIAQQRETGDTLADDDATPLAVLTGVLLWVLRLTLAPASTLSGFRGWVLEECSVAPGRRAEIEPPSLWTGDNFACPDCGYVVSLNDGCCAGCGWPDKPHGQADTEGLCPDCLSAVTDEHGFCVNCGPAQPAQSKTARFLQLVEARHGSFAAIDPARVGEISRQLAPEADLDTGSARAALRPRVLAAQNGHAK